MNTFLNLQGLMESTVIFESMTEIFKKEHNIDSCFSASLKLLEDFEVEVDKLRLQTFKAITEAEVKKDENTQFSRYFDEFSKLVRGFTGKINELSSNAIIKITNLVDMNEDLIEDPDVAARKINPFNMSFEVFKNIDSDTIPQFTARKIYVKDFDAIGKLIQQLGPVASNSAKLAILTSAYNTLSSEMDSNFIQKTTESLIGDSYDKTKSYAEQVYRLFRAGATDREISRGDIIQARATLMGYVQFVNILRNTAQQLVDDFNNIANSVSDMMYQNRAGVISINSEDDGVETRDYRIDAFGMNQLNIFMKKKTDQLMQVINMYVVAYSIKADATVDFISQQLSILEKAKNNVATVEEEPEDGGEAPMGDDTSMGSEEPEGGSEPSLGGEEPELGGGEEPSADGEIDSDTNDGVSSDMDDDSDEDDDDDDEDDEEEGETLGGDDKTVGELGDSDEDDDDSSEEGETLGEDEDAMSDTDDGSGEDSNGDGKNSVDDIIDDAKVEEAVMFFEYECYQLGRIERQYSLNEAYIQIIAEADGDLNSGIVQANTTKRIDFVAMILEKLEKLWNKFKEIFVNRTTPRIKALKEHETDIKQARFAQNATVNHFNHEVLEKVVVPEFNYAAMKDLLGDRNAFVTKFIYTPMGITNPKQDANISSNIKDAVYPPDKKEAPINEAWKTRMFTFCTQEYDTIAKQCDKDKNALRKGKLAAGRIANDLDRATAATQQGNAASGANATAANGTTSNNASADLSYFFSEAFNPGDGAKSTKTDVQNYFKICSSVVSVKMSLANTIFNEYYRALSSLYTQGKGNTNANNVQNTLK